MVGGSGGGTKDLDWSMEQALAQIQQLLGAVNNLQHTIAQQGQTIAQLQAQATATPPGMGTPFCGPKMATPPIYNGSMATCEAFINSCQLYMLAKPQEFPTLRIKVTWVLGFMQNGMAQMFQDHFLVYMATPEFQTQYKQSTEPDQIELLYCNIYKAFGDPNKQATVIQEVTTIKQGSKLAEEHVQLFKQSYMRSGYDKCMAVLELPITLEKWYKLVIRLDCQWRQAVAEHKVFAACGGSGASGQSSSMQRTGQQGQTWPTNLQQGFNQQAQ
ncbi:hypothetical protein AMATHDRAFT_9846 [Amanita thiersii Skay4041]|uniref:Retrotransposon gag domain-containing protein n=1 Tax=Amanita thiersii Skay4041 TaxID=703135 RepID=A0A2A9NC34_9AGAR|nr:hypothetical protein AMATHDRAFT_9846 [Amanita thiersii Skay4041]